MKPSHFVSAVLGGLVVCAGFVALGATTTPRTETIVEEAPVAVQPAANAGAALTAHAIYQRDAPGVVFVRARLVAPSDNPFSLLPGQASDVSTGSGFLVDHQGDILTNYHVIDGADRSEGVSVEFEGGVTRRATVVAVDATDDLAVLHAQMNGVPPVRPLSLGDSTSVRVGDPTLAIGNPFGLDRTLTSGIVSSLQHQIVAADGQAIDNVIQTDQPVDAGNSGGPLLNASGQVVGIDSQVATADTGAGEPLAFAVPIDTADQLLSRVEHSGAVRLATLGVTGPTATPGRTGAVVSSVVRGGPAALAGLEPGDTIQRIDGLPMHSIGQVLAVVRTRSPGQSLSLAVRRGRRLRTATVVLGSLSEPVAGS